MTQKSRQKFKYHENKKSFSGETKSIFDHFKRAFNSKNCLRPGSAPLIQTIYVSFLMIQGTGSYYVNLSISKEKNCREKKIANKRKWEIDVHFMR